MTDIRLHAWPTPNAYKISIMLEECGLDYAPVPVNLMQGDQHTQDFLSLNPNGKMPVLEDSQGPDGDPITIFESGAILIYLAEKTDQFLPASGTARYAVLQWLMWQMGGFGPMLGQAHHFRIYAPERVQYAYDRYTNESIRLYDVLERTLSENTYVAGADYSIADMAIYPWATGHDKQGVDLSDKPHVQKWLESIGNRAAVQRGMRLMEEHKRDLSQNPLSEAERASMFGQKPTY
jgi:GST-like protein